MTSADLALVLAAVIAAVTSIVVVIRQTRKDRSDIATAVSDAWGKLVQPLEARVSALEKENKRLRRENLALWSYIEDLRGLLRLNHIEAPELPELEEK
jgi:hypothetical protein